MAKVERMRPPYFPCYADDILGSFFVQQMEADQFGWYMKMLLRSWTSALPCHIPNDVDWLWKYAGATTQRDFDERGGIVLQRFEVTGDGKYIYNKRLLAEYETIVGRYKANAKAAKKRWSGTSSVMRAECDRIADGNRAVSQSEPEPEPEPDSKSKTKTKKRPVKLPFILPGWVPKNDWDDWEEMRRKKGSPMTDRARELSVEKLASFQNKGHPPAKVLQLAIERGWTGLFEPREQIGNGNGNSKAQRIQDDSNNAIKAAADRLKRKAAGDSQSSVSEPNHDHRNGGTVLDGVWPDSPRVRVATAGRSNAGGDS